MPTLETGHVFERYRVIRSLGSGVSGESYEAEDAMLLRKVTLKLIHPQSTLPDSARRQFFRELQGTSALNHPYLAPVLDYGEMNGRLYIARKFVSSGSLLGTEGRLWFRPPFNISDAIHYAHQLAQALHYIHSRGYLHGAITFSNILVVRGPNLDNEADYAPFLLADVGLANFARRFGQEPKPPLPVTAAPEQIGKRVTPASDQFALAVLLYFWLAGRPPDLGTPEEIEQMKLTESVAPLSTLNPEISMEQNGILLRALSVYPEDRYPTILAFGEALLKTLPPIIPTIPKTEPPQFEVDVILTPSPLPVPAESAEEPVMALHVSDDEQPIARDFDREPTVTPVLAPSSEFVASEDVLLEPPHVLPEDEEEIFAYARRALMPEPPLLPWQQEQPEEDDSAPVPSGAEEAEEKAQCARVIITSPYAEQPYEVQLDGDEFSVGRAGSSAILLDQDNLTSRHHALLKRESNHFWLYDMRSANGVFVNGQKIVAESGYELLDGDHISIGNYEMIFRSTASIQEKEAATDELHTSSEYEITQLV